MKESEKEGIIWTQLPEEGQQRMGKGRRAAIHPPPPMPLVCDAGVMCVTKHLA